VQIGLKSRIRFGFLLILVVFVGTLLFAVHRMHLINDDLRLIQRGYLTMARLATQVQTLQETQDEYILRAFSEDNINLQKHLVRYTRNFYAQRLKTQLNALEAHSRAILKSTLAQRDVNFFRSMQEQIATAKEMHLAYEEITNVVLDGIDDSTALQTDDVFRLYQRRSDELSKEIKSIGLRIENRISSAVSAAERNDRESTNIIEWASLLALLIGLSTIFTVNRGFIPFRHLLDSARRIGRGSLDVVVEVDGPDEVGDLAREFNLMAKALRDREKAFADQNQDLVRLKGFSEDVIRSVRIGIIVLNAEGKILALNPAARSVFRIPLVDAEERNLSELQPSDSPIQDLLLELNSVLENGVEKSSPLVKVQDRVLDIALVPIRDRAGVSSDDLLLLGEDVTNREETRERLVESERLAAIGRIAAQITHEIRNPLSSVGLNIELLGDDIPFLPENRQDEASAIVAAVGKEVERLTHITEGYLRYARLPAPQQTPGDVGDLLADLCAFYQSEAHQAGVMLELQIENQIPDVSYDTARLRQALLNLLRNAQEAAGKGGTVRLIAQKLPRETADGVRLSVEDSGSGITEETKARLFEPFFTTKKSGTGLGLTLTQEIVREHGASLHVGDSSLGGAVFNIDLYSNKEESV
jgi:nitrogen fixation/metabolism regulation signal transduction histidine kinase